MEFRISELSNWKYEFLITLHELVEWALIHNNGIPIKTIDDFDILFEKERAEGKHGQYEEPGSDPRAPYGPMHQIAAAFEMTMAQMLQVDWNEYSKAVDNL